MFEHCMMPLRWSRPIGCWRVHLLVVKLWREKLYREKDRNSEDASRRVLGETSQTAPSLLHHATAILYSPTRVLPRDEEVENVD